MELKTLDTPKQRLAFVADWFAGQGGRQFKTMHDVEKMDLAALRATPVAGTMFEHIVGQLWEAGCKPESKIGAVIDAFEIDQTQVNKLACYCVNGDQVIGTHIATSLRGFANDKTA